MSNNIDERVVSMKFNNGQFLTGIAATIEALAKLKHGLNLEAPTKGLDQLSRSASNFPHADLSQGIQNVSAKFLALGTIGVTALANLTNSAIAAGTQLVKSLTVEPVKLGLEEYETKLNSIQTILANTSAKGTTLDQVNGTLKELNEYSDKTIYNFAEMARNIGTFTAAGVDLDVATGAIKGIANLAAVSGSNAQQASTAMYQLSQSLAAGKVSLEDWNSVVNAGMGGEVFQNALKETARVHGVAVDSIIEEQGSFRNSLQEGWITSEILTETLSKFTGDLTEAQLQTMGYNQEQIAGILKMGVTASDAATKVKTMSQLIGTLKESAQSGWAETWEIVIGNFDEAKTMFTEVNNTIGALIGASADARNHMLEDWKALGGRTALIDAIKNSFNALMGIVKPIGEAFRDIFPAMTGERLFEITEAIRDFTATLKLGQNNTDNLKRTFKGLFALLDIGLSIIKGVVTAVGRMFGAMDGGGTDVLEFTAHIGDLLVKLNEAIKNSEGFKEFFEDLGDALAVPIKLLRSIAGILTDAFSFDPGSGDALEGFLERISTRLQPFEALGNAVAKAWRGMGNVLKEVVGFMAPFATEVGNFMSKLGLAISNAVSTGDFSQILDTINTGLFAALVVGVRKFLSDGSIFNFGGDGEGFLDSIKSAFGGLTDTLSAMQANLQSGTLLKIAGAIALLTASVVALSLIDSAKLTKALSAMTVMFLQLAGAMAVLDKITSTGIAFKLAPMAVGLILLSVAILALTASVAVLSTMSWEELSKGLAGVVVLLGAVAGAVKLLKGGGAGLIAAGAGMVAMAVGIKILASAVKDFSEMSWEDMGQGLAGVAVALGVIAGAMKLMPPTLPLTALGLIGVSVALAILAQALKSMGSMSWEEIGKSMVVLAGSLAILAGAMYLMTAGLPGAAAMLVIAPAIVILAGALKIMASLSWEEIGKMATVLAGSLLIIAGGMYLMTAALPGAAALLVVSAALAILAPVLIALGGMSWEEIGRGLTVLAGALAIIGVAGLVLTPVIPTLLGLGVAVALIGVGMLAAGAGLLAFSAGLVALSVAGAAGTAALVAIVSGLIGLIPMALNAVALGLVLMAEVIANSAPTFVRAITALLMALLTTIDVLAPKIVETLFGLILLLVNTVTNNIPKFVDAGLRMITGILRGVANNIGGIVTAAIDIVTNFIDGISKALPRLVQAGINLIITFVESLAAGIRNNSARMRNAGWDLATAIIDGMTGGIFSGSSSVINAAARMASSALAAAKKILGIKSPSKKFFDVGMWSGEGAADGFDKSSPMVDRAAEKVGTNAMAAFKESLKGIEDKVLSDIDANPTIRPVLDLTQIKKDAEQIPGMLPSESVSVGTSYSNASAISKMQAPSAQETGELVNSAPVTNISYVQNNTSPKALSPVEIYRQTKNQLSTVKGALSV